MNSFRLQTKIILAITIGTVFACQPKETTKPDHIVNIINFIRQTEPRIDEITDEVLYQTVVNQIDQLNQYSLPGTFLLQYDALINPKYQSLLKANISKGMEVGGWWEITQPHVEAAGMQWRGRFPWDWHADVGFATGYTPDEREKLVDVYMEKFLEIFGKYPASVGSWFIDAHTLGYMHDKYGITASCNCKDQIGTDGYTLWGGYWNQAYYPSRKNAYMPAQNINAQIPVPIFRMLGSDPIYQYDTGLGSSHQGVISLEPVYTKGGGNRKWVKWFFKSMFEDPYLTFNYVQAGQENSFTWKSMKKGLEIQIPLLDSLRKQGKIRVETLEESGKWFKKQFPVTPPTALSALTDIQENGNKTLWFNSRYYRTNLLWHDKSFRFRDIHMFDETFASDYIDKAGTSTQCIYKTLPVVDGFSWSKRDSITGLRIMFTDENQQLTEIELEDPSISSPTKNTLLVECNSTTGKSFRILFKEDMFEVSCNDKDFKWFLEFKTPFPKRLPFTSIDNNSLYAIFNGHQYHIDCQANEIKEIAPGRVQFIPANGKTAFMMNCRH